MSAVGLSPELSLSSQALREVAMCRVIPEVSFIQMAALIEPNQTVAEGFARVRT